MSGIIFSENSGVVNSIFGKSQDPIKSFLEKRAEAFEKESIVNKIFNEEKSTNYAEKYKLEFEDYNGWCNRDTWLVMLWLNNDYENYQNI